MKKMLIAFFALALFNSCNNEKKEEKPAEAAAAPAEPAKKMAFDVLDLSAGDAVLKSAEAFSKKDVDGMLADYDDNVMFRWSSGDSLVGKQAVKNYYAGRIKLIDTLTFGEHIILPIVMNDVQAKTVRTGKWILFWTETKVKYKNGKTIMFWQHSTNHVNDAGKVDQVNQFIDRGQIAAATAGMKVK